MGAPSELIRSLICSSKSGRMGHQMTQRDRLRESGRDFEIQIRVDIAVQIQLVLFHQLHYRRPGKQLGNGAGTEQGAVTGNRGFLFHVAVAVATRKKHSSVFHNQNHRPCYVLSFQLHRHKTIQKRFNVSGSHFMGCFCCFSVRGHWLFWGRRLGGIRRPLLGKCVG